MKKSCTLIRQDSLYLPVQFDCKDRTIANRLLLWTIVTALVGGTLYRLWPIVSGQPALAEFFITEDGYLMLTIARNLAIGFGMSVSEGTIVTNGVQPLVTFLFTLPYFATGGDKLTSLVGVHVILAATALAGMFAVRSFAHKVLQAQSAQPLWPWLAATLWFVGPLLVMHTMNGLETGFYTLMVVLALLQFARVLKDAGTAKLGARLALGALCGLVFLTRNDGVFLVTAIFGIWFLHATLQARLGLGTVIRHLVPPGVLSLVFAAPWLIYNQLNFGSIVPISGSAQSLTATFGQNAALIPAKLFEYLFPMLPVPGGVEGQGAFMVVASGLVLAILGGFLVRTWRRGGTIRLVIAAYVLYGILLVSYYGLYFGAPHFMSRYLAPLAPLLIVATLSVLIDIALKFFSGRTAPVIAGAGLGAIGLSVVLLARLLVPGAHTHGHFQVVGWVDANIAATTWVGAVQTGTLGYWHDRTINLDGKVNPAALSARRTKGHVLGYVVDSEIDYIIDWVGVAGWASSTQSGFAGAFELAVEDRPLNLAVLRRRELRQPELR